jgi:hypothetical protein
MLHYVVPAAKVFGFLFSADNVERTLAAHNIPELAHDAVRSWGGSPRRAVQFSLLEVQANR